MTHVERAFIRDNGQLSAYAWPGRYPMYYICPNGDSVCAKCAESIITANRNEALLIALGAEQSPLSIMLESIGITRDRSETPTHIDINWEDTNMYCAECDDIIESAYVE